jgi:hypothetical protein
MFKIVCNFKDDEYWWRCAIIHPSTIIAKKILLLKSMCILLDIVGVISRMMVDVYRDFSLEQL